ncbi:MAG: 2-(hydroxymethyl)glutarate dehydrogenase [Alphaproteobacteria bacterium MarineAlpha5_Bin11]|nr:3-hydroxyisobutyrate dehydrogenase [Pelagibacteraceae bacterium]PPR43033.1 MAG: 2-(hydroxymethyl)glutarate dehydrogenase [Alphaproteobacteria bacterium MarineAlpha5_Bin11]|tara:strand:+ start:9550 stop:10491 length:942 start_codon:yes stop_codon:yes gene_type:complete
MKIGFIGLGNVGSKLASIIIKKKYDLYVRDLNKSNTDKLKKLGAHVLNSPKEIAENADVIITCLPSPEICAKVMESKDGVIQGMSKNKIWLEMSTTDSNEVKRLGAIVNSKGGIALDGPVSGGCHRAKTGNISIFVSGKRKGFEKVFPILTVMGKDILYAGKLGNASILKVITNFLATSHLVALGEAMTLAKMSKIDLKKTYKAIKASSGNSFVHETESQVILNGSYNINFTMDLVLKDISLFNKLSKKNKVKLELSPFLLKILSDGVKRYGNRAWSSMIVKRFEDDYNIKFRSSGFPKILTDKSGYKKGIEI